MTRRSRIAAALACLATATTAFAAPASKPKSIVVLEIAPSEAFPAAVTKLIADFLAGALRDQGYAVIRPGDVVALLDVERKKQVMGCADTSCLAEIGGAYGVDYVVLANLAVLGDKTGISITLVDNKAAAVGRVRSLVKGSSSSDIAEEVERLVPDLVAPLKQGAGVAAGGGARLAGWGLVGLGAAGLAAGGVSGWLARSTVTTWSSHPVTPANLASFESESASASSEARIATLSLAAAGACLGIGAALLLLLPLLPNGAPAPVKVAASPGGIIVAMEF